MERIAIIGLGLIGGSIGLGLKRANLPDTQIVGTARTRDTVQRAKKLGAIDIDARSAAEAVEGARVVIVAASTAVDRQTQGAHPDADIVRLIREQEAPSPDRRLAILQAADEA